MPKLYGGQKMRFSIKNESLKKSCPILFFSILLLFLSSCTNLAHIKQFSETSTETATFEQLVEDYVGYPDRVIRLQPESQKSALEKTKQDRLDQKEGLNALHQTMTNYMAALGKLAEDNIVSYDAELDSAAKTLRKSKFVKMETVEASGEISKILFKAFTDLWRKRQLSKIIDQSNSNFQTLIDGLKFITEQGFLSSLDIEMAVVDKVFNNSKMDLKHRTKDKQIPPEISLMLEEWKSENQNSIENKKKLIASYAEVLDKIGEGHQSLYDNRNDLSKKKLIAELKKYGKDMVEIYKSIQNL